MQQKHDVFYYSFFCINLFGGSISSRMIANSLTAGVAMRSIPIIEITSYALNGEEKGREAGYDDYVRPRQLY